MDTVNARQLLRAARRVVVKVGSSLLVSKANDHLRLSWMQALARDISSLRQQGCDVVLVSSGAVALGRQLSGASGKSLKLEEKQAMAAIGQVELAGAWKKCFAHHDIAIGQVLLTVDDTENRRRWLNSSSTLHTLLKLGVMPLINENDSVASDEIRYGDNDRLAARAAQMVAADLLVLLSDVDGLYSEDPLNSKTATHIPLVLRITDEITSMAGHSASGPGTGGMTTKLLAAGIASPAGCATIIADGQEQAPLSSLLDGARNTVFLPQLKPAQARKNWIAGSVQPKGSLHIDAGAAHALREGASLLAAGITKVHGQFERGEAVHIMDDESRNLALGLVSYSAQEVTKIRGLRSDQIQGVLGYVARKAVVHRDNMVISA